MNERVYSFVVYVFSFSWAFCFLWFALFNFYAAVLFYVLLYYVFVFCRYFLGVSFLMSRRKGVDPEGKECGKERGGVEGGKL